MRDSRAPWASVWAKLQPSSLLLPLVLAACSGNDTSTNVTLGMGGSSGSAQGGAASLGGNANPSGGTSTTAQGGASGGNTSGGGSVGGAAGGNASGGSGGSVPEDSQPPPKLCQITMACQSPIIDDEKVTCTFQVVDGAGVSIFADHAGVELRGRSSINYDKQNYGLELRDAAGMESPVNMLGMGKESDWVLDGSWVDRSFMRNMLTFSLFRDMGSYAARGRFCTMTLNGAAQGIYEIREKIKRDDDRVALTLDDGTGKSFLLKQDQDGTLQLSIGAGNRWQLVYPKQETANAAQVAAAQSFLSQLDAAMNSQNPGDPATGLPALLDITQVADWILIEEFSKNVDAYNLSLYFARDAGKPARIVPWDMDLSYGQPTVRNAMNELTSGWVNTRTRLITSLLKIESLRSSLGPRWRTLRAGPLSNAAIQRKLDRYQTTLDAAAIAQNFSIWPLADVDFTPIYRPYSLYPVSSYSDEVTKVRAWIDGRLTYMDAHIDTYPN
ncbi:MAG: CotH kinase family protein [Polyangiaceae bacterium]